MPPRLLYLVPAGALWYRGRRFWNGRQPVLKSGNLWWPRRSPRDATL